MGLPNTRLPNLVFIHVFLLIFCNMWICMYIRSYTSWMCVSLMYACKYFCCFHEIYIISNVVNNGESMTSNFCFMFFFSYLNSYALLNPYIIIKYLNCLFCFLSEIIFVVFGIFCYSYIYFYLFQLVNSRFFFNRQIIIPRYIFFHNLIW